jgi:glutathione S-transferase
VKGLKYKTTFIDFADIESVCIQLGAKPTGIKFDGSGRPRYTLPMIHDPRHGPNHIIADSFKIAEYLDKAYPDTPRLLPQGTKVLQEAFVSTFEKNVKLWPILVPAAHAKLSDRGQGHYRKLVEHWVGKKLEELSPPGPVRDGCWKQVREWLDVVDKWFQKEDHNGLYVMGETMSFADIGIASVFTWARKVLGESSEEWQDLIRWNEGRWGRVIVSFDKYGTVH